jgi:transposase-like protein
MVQIAVKCPKSASTNVGKHGYGKKGQARYKCKNNDCRTTTFQLEYHYNGCKPGIEADIIRRVANCGGIRDTARSLKISKRKVSSTLKKQNLS